MEDIKKWFLSKIHKGENIIQYKRSYKHPLLNKRYFSDSFGYFKITKIWNIKSVSDCCWFNYEKRHNVKWDWKVEIVTDIGRYIYPLYHLYNLKFADENGKLVSDKDMFIFYK